MSFKEFDLTDYISALEDFKSNQVEEVIKHWGSVENFDLFIQKIKEDEDHVAKLAIQQFGSIEKYTETMKHNLEHFSELMDERHSRLPEEMRTDDKFLKLASHRGEEVALDSIQNIVKEIIAYAHGNVPSELIGDEQNYCHTIIETYSNDYLKKVIDTKYGEGVSEYIVKAFECYVKTHFIK